MSQCGGCASARERSGDESEELSPTTAVRYGKMGFVGEFAHSPDLRLRCGGSVVITTERGIEIGEQLSHTCFGCDQALSREQMISYGQASDGGDSYRQAAGRILRSATEADLVELKHIEQGVPEKLDICRRFAGELGLQMKIVDCEQILGGERIVFYFMSEERVDFRQLVRQLASEFQTRIEMRQVGARDEARLLADYETCGRECCCKSFLKTLKPITMSMAKLQKTTLDLAKVSGRCGRLKCCLRFEHKTYDELNKQLPRNNCWVSTTEGIGKIIDRQVLTQLVRIRTADGRVAVVPAENILETNVEPPPPPEETPVSTGRSGNGPGRRPRNGKGKADSRSRSTSTEQGTSDKAGSPPAQAGAPGTDKPQDTEHGGNQDNTAPAQSDATDRSSRRRRGQRGKRSRRKGRGRKGPQNQSNNPDKTS